MRRRLAWRRLAVAGMLCVAAVPAAARAQSPDEPPPGTLVLGPVRITPNLALRDTGIDNNVKNEAVDPKSDFTFTLTPRATVAFRMRRLRATYDLTTDYVYFRTYREEGGTNTGSSGRIEVDLGRLRPYAYVQGTDTKARLNTEVDARARHHDLVYGAGGSLLIASRTRLLVSGTTSRVAYDPGETFRGVDLRDSFNSRRESLAAGIGLELTPLTTMNVLVGHDRQHFSLSPDRDSESWRIGPTITFSPDGLLTGSASVGYRRFRTLSPLLPDYSGLTSAVTVGATIYGRHQLQVIANRDVQYSYDEVTQYYVGTSVSAAWTLAIVGPFDVRATGSRGLMDYRGDHTTDGGRDTFTSYGGGIGYHIAARARIGVDTDWSHRGSTRSRDREFRNHRLFAGLTWGIR